MLLRRDLGTVLLSICEIVLIVHESVIAMQDDCQQECWDANLTDVMF